MQTGPRPPGSTQPPVKIYNAVYSSVQVYECMVRGIVVMRRRNDSYVNATQILKVGGVDKGRRTKILKKKILPGKHEIVQGGHVKCQGTWHAIPLAKGREIAEQYGGAPLLSPLFDFTPPSSSGGTSPSFSGYGTPKRNCSEADADFGSRASSHISFFQSSSQLAPLDSAPDIQTKDGPSPAKRARTDASSSSQISWQLLQCNDTQSLPSLRDTRPTSQVGANGASRPPSARSGHPVLETHVLRFSSKPLIPRLVDPSAPLRDTRRSAVVAAIFERDDSAPVLDPLREITSAQVPSQNTPQNGLDVDTVIDDQGHTALTLMQTLHVMI
ncbi:hypothetical protein H2248_002284 [Termitomyces sp. 'cryptogamus']|nr:hypothetical protein H2248_002284 [Termitomyces sp. 'cryptogamus']